MVVSEFSAVSPLGGTVTVGVALRVRLRRNLMPEFPINIHMPSICRSYDKGGAYDSSESMDFIKNIDIYGLGNIRRITRMF